MIKAWERKQRRERLRDASLQHIIALGAGMKKQHGGKLTIFDFVPDLKPEETEEQKEAVIKAYFMKLAAQPKAKKAK